MTLLKVKGISKKGTGEFLLKDISFSQGKLQKIAIAGETGAGKSTLLKIIAGLIQPDRGEVLFQHKKVVGPDEQLVPGHPAIAYLSQHFELQKFLRVEQVLTYSNTLSDSEADTLYDICQISHLLKRTTDQLSGGEKQRIAICRLLISSPGLLLLDEPFSHLDMVHKNTLKSVIHDIGKKLKITCMLVSHDPLDTLSWADKILVMKDGQLVQKGKPEMVYRQPVDEYVGGLFGPYNLIGDPMLKKLSTWSPIKQHVARAGSKRMFIRPEGIRLINKRKQALRGKVNTVRFFGSYREMEISLGKMQTVSLRTNQEGIQPGDTVYITVDPDGIWFV